MADGGLRAQPQFWPVALLSVALVAVLGGWSTASYLERTRREPACADRTTLRVAAAPSIAPPARDIARRFSARERCLDVVVEARESVDVLRDLARSAVPADAWLPESTLWLRRARAAGAFGVPVEGVSVATTPVVLALDRWSAMRLDRQSTAQVDRQSTAQGDQQSTARPDRALGWRALLADPKPPLPVVLPDPTTSPVGFGALVGIRDLARTAAPRAAAAAAAAVMRRLAPRTVSPDGDVPPAPTGPGAGEAAVVSTEQEVLLAAADGRRQVAVYPPAAVPGLDYPYAVLTAGPGRDGATAFLRALLAAEGVTALTGHGLRTPRGAPPAGIPAGTGLRTGAYPPVRLPAEPAALALLNAWGGVHISARMLAVFDISGSMAAQVPGSAQTRLAATIEAAQGGARLLLSTTELGVWVFATDLDGRRDYREVVPVGPVGPRRAQIVAELGRMRVQPNGATGLYDTTLAAYRDATRNWTPGRINMVLILTDGRDDNASGIGRTELLRELGALVDRKRPVPILFIGVGPEIDPAELRQIAHVTGGRVALTAKPSGIRQIFYTALAEFSCLPPECRR